MSKKKLIFIITLLIIIPLFSVQAFAAGYTLGDPDNDGKITAGDARLALRASVGLEYLSSYEKGASDIDADGTITAGDARKILRTSVNLETIEKRPIHVYSSDCDYSDEKVVKEASCKEKGKIEMSCLCGKTKTKSIEKTEHIPGDEYVYTREPTCENSGYGYVKCIVCGDSISGTSTFIDKLGHLGNGEYCERCNKVNPNYLPQFGLGETWTVDGNWELTITDVKLHKFCNSVTNKNEGYGNYVVLVYYTYKNIGYIDDIWGDGLYISYSDFDVYDSEGNSAHTYPCTHETSPKECIVGTKSSASAAFVLQSYDGTLMLSIDEYDADGNTRRAVFNIDTNTLEEPEKPTPDTGSSDKSTALTLLCNGNTWKSEIGVNGTQVDPLTGWTLTFNQNGTAVLSTGSSTYYYTLDFIGKQDNCYVFDMHASNSNVSMVYDYTKEELCVLIRDDMGVFFY